MTAKRIIQYGDKKMDMPDGMTLDEAKVTMARFFPELAEPKVENKKDGDTTVYVFTKQAGRKGLDEPHINHCPWTVKPMEIDRAFKQAKISEFWVTDSRSVLLASMDNQSDAQLIAAAPDLLDALKDIIEQAEKTRLIIGADLADSIFVFGKAAVAKAEGRKPE